VVKWTVRLWVEIPALLALAGWSAGVTYGIREIGVLPCSHDEGIRNTSLAPS
jgi:hypothetical protein